MTTLAHPTTVFLAHEWEALPDYPSAVISGIVGDLAHQRNGGYHISIQDQPADNYSVTRPDDKAPPGDWPRNLAAAIDMSMSLADMKLCHARLKAVWADHTDPRRIYLNAFNGWDGTGSPGRYDFYANTSGTSSIDHEWHTHGELRRRWAASMVAARGILSMLKGETKKQYLDTKGDSMPIPYEPVMGLYAKLIYEDWSPTREDWLKAKGVPGIYDSLAAAGSGRNNLRLHLDAQDAMLKLILVNQGVAQSDIDDIQARTGSIVLAPSDIAALRTGIVADLIASDTNELSADDKTAIEEIIDRQLDQFATGAADAGV